MYAGTWVELVVLGAAVEVAAHPEELFEEFSVVLADFLEHCNFLLGDDGADFLLHPLLVASAQLVLSETASGRQTRLAPLPLAGAVGGTL